MADYYVCFMHPNPIMLLLLLLIWQQVTDFSRDVQ